MAEGDSAKPSILREPLPASRAGPLAADHLVTKVIRASTHDTAGSLRYGLAHDEPRLDSADTIWLVDDADRLCGAIPMARLLAAPADTLLADLADPSLQAVHPGTDQEQIASLALLHGWPSVPVVDAQERFLGVVPALALLEVMRHEHVEDIHRFAGISPELVRARDAIEAPPIRRARDRLPWLVVGLAGSMAATLLVSSFEETLRERVAIAYFVPGIVYLADAVGTQSEAIAVRGLSLSRLPLRHVLAGELRTGALIGLILALLAMLPVWLWFGDGELALAVAIALFAASACATTIGFALPWLLSRSGRDPAFGSGPIATIVQDLLSLLIYFATVRVLLT